MFVKSSHSSRSSLVLLVLLVKLRPVASFHKMMLIVCKSSSEITFAARLQVESSALNASLVSPLHVLCEQSCPQISRDPLGKPNLNNLRDNTHTHMHSHMHVRRLAHRPGFIHKSSSLKSTDVKQYEKFSCCTAAHCDREFKAYYTANLRCISCEWVALRGLRLVSSLVFCPGKATSTHSPA